MFEYLGRFDDAVFVSELIMERFPFSPHLQIQHGLVSGRCLAALGRGQEAAAKFRVAAAEAARVKANWHALMIARDGWIAGPAAAPAPLGEIGRAIAAMEAQQLSAYTRLLGHGLDAEAALLEFARRQRNP